MIELSKKRIDDSYEADNMLVQVSDDKEPVLIEIFKASRFFQHESQALPHDVKKAFFAAV